MMCRPLRAVMVGRRYAIIVPENRDIRFARAASGRESVTSRIRHTFASLSLSLRFFSFSFSHQRSARSWRLHERQTRQARLSRADDHPSAGRYSC